MPLENNINNEYSIEKSFWIVEYCIECCTDLKGKQWLTAKALFVFGRIVIISYRVLVEPHRSEHVCHHCHVLVRCPVGAVRLAGYHHLEPVPRRPQVNQRSDHAMRCCEVVFASVNCTVVHYLLTELLTEW